MDAEKFWSTTEMNKFLYQQLKAMCEANGFVLSPRKGKHLVKIAEHFIQIVCPEVSYGRTRIHVLVSPAGSFSNYFYANKDRLNRWCQFTLTNTDKWRLADKKQKFHENDKWKSDTL